MESIKESIFKFLRLDGLINNLSGYVEARIELIKLEVREEVTKIVSRGLMLVIVFFLGLLFLVFLSFGLANYFNKYFNDSYSGYWIIATVYGLPCILMVLFRKKISHYFERYLLEQSKRKH
ncbi:MAG: hypothetical protein OJF59_001097 [Cytophagales bacterium]|jgi:uncharacterized membrane protein YqjE|nr:phage holin family protein [Bacteroidota bacterium]MBS1979911.1 phage holin family protein [Bacteroidota bacterium]WHZ07344.1 MAG: hypothetical protein OJF59_001097 [Cytophagales bacterium]